MIFFLTGNRGLLKAWHAQKRLFHLLCSYTVKCLFLKENNTEAIPKLCIFNINKTYFHG
jgi:hypothetical protein